MDGFEDNCSMDSAYVFPKHTAVRAAAPYRRLTRRLAFEDSPKPGRGRSPMREEAGGAHVDKEEAAKARVRSLEANFSITPGSSPLFHDIANVGVTQARAWLAGAVFDSKCGGGVGIKNRVPKFELQQSGSETV
ncbi:hypothetical protein B0H67DRAFT_645136 [Lasiosphaeris hirsuta]|uniref:Uncharacterized protein n=1 Tax=Lasiosphaeris hirsuta TaxID=260670 RepID=A0AA40AGD0_9PEZI|nr:hypothetical protein B0H67DRAFT_645136 [Lasiosphaeris hirsuta]